MTNSADHSAEAEAHIRAATNADSAGVIALIGKVYAEYGDRMHLEKADSDLPDLERAYGGEFWVLDDAGMIRGSVAIRDAGEGACQLKRLYLDDTLRGGGWGERLLHWAMDRARESGYGAMHFWTDVRFTRAHAFYERRGFVADGRTRTLDDAWEPYTEYFYSRAL